MSSLRRLTGIVINRVNVGGSDRRIVLFCADGVRVLRARGTQKLASKLAGSLEPLTLVEVTTVRGRSGEQVIGSSIRDPFTRIHASVAKIAAAGVITGSVESLVRGLHDEILLFRRIREAFALISVSRTNRSLMLGAAYGLWNLLAATGYASADDRRLAAGASGRLASVLLRGNANAVRTIRCSVPTARACADAALRRIEHAAEQRVPAGRFFSYVMCPAR